MRRIVVINAKGGCGKTTIATNIASLYANKGFGTALFDYDPQGSSINWLKVRGHGHAPVLGVAAHSAQNSVTRTFALRVPPHINRIVLDTPAGLKGHRLGEMLKDNDTIVIPVSPSAIDLHATADFMRDLLVVIKARSRRMRLAIIANRMRAVSPSLTAFETFVESLRIPVIARLRDSHHYLMASEQGLGVHELELAESNEAQLDQNIWAPVFEWIESDPAYTAPVVTPRLVPQASEEATQTRPAQ